MPDTDTDRGDNEFWCGTCTGVPEEVDGIPVDEYFEAETPGQAGPDRNEGFAPMRWAVAVIRKVRTFGRQ